MNFPIIAIVGTSGSGKSSSLENLDPETTLILNIENKILPFRDAAKFKHCLFINDTTVFETELVKGLKKDSIFKTLVIESFTFYAAKIEEKARKISSGWEIWNFYNEKLNWLFETIRNNGNKIVVMIAIDEVVKLMSSSGAETNQRRIATQGKRHEGKVEFHFPIVLFTMVKAEKDKPTKYQFVTNSDGLITAKSPRGMFEMLIDNDLNKVITKAKEYYGLK